ncbi:hypothetical protein [Nereida sp. MMG025]|uniref:hypothetical protein n=1 Tax=Nereida sp. MMG025 TaxID=2909981 RepID=UPI001F3F1CE7|nr:hypothetical protein [Nereida sp. MMG025]MCF6445124.1 hypothetical protein [Nereida sp. MMG025]
MLEHIPEDGVIARVQASPGRRIFGCGAIVALGMLLVLLAFTQGETGFGYRIFLMGCGVMFLTLGSVMWRATQIVIELTEHELRDSTGVVLAPLDNINKVERGVFAFKPSNGFLVRLKDSAPRGWRPGLWWRAGKMIGVGGVTPSGEGKFMAEALAFLLAQRDNQT